MCCDVPPNSQNKQKKKSMETSWEKMNFDPGTSKKHFWISQDKVSNVIVNISFDCLRATTSKHSIWFNIRHSLCEERVSPGFTDDQISPLYNHNTDEKCSVASVL